MRKAIVAASIFWYLAVGRSVGRTRASNALWDDVGLAPTSSIGNAARGTSFIGSFIHYRLLVSEWTHTPCQHFLTKREVWEREKFFFRWIAPAAMLAAWKNLTFSLPYILKEKDLIRLYMSYMSLESNFDLVWLPMCLCTYTSALVLPLLMGSLWWWCHSERSTILRSHHLSTAAAPSPACLMMMITQRLLAPPGIQRLMKS